MSKIWVTEWIVPRGQKSSIPHVLVASIRHYDKIQKDCTSEHLLDEITVSMEDPNPNIVLL